MDGVIAAECEWSGGEEPSIGRGLAALAKIADDEENVSIKHSDRVGSGEIERSLFM